MLDCIRFAPVPVVAAISGSCLGAGLEIALACHFRVAAAGALLGFVESELGLMPGMSGTVDGELPRGERIRMVLSAEMIGADEARDRGLLQQCCPRPRLMDCARELLERMVARRSSALIHAAMRSMHNAMRCERIAALREESHLFCRLVRDQFPAAKQHNP